MATGWAMTKNYAGGCTYDLPHRHLHPAQGLHEHQRARSCSPPSSAARATCRKHATWPTATCSWAAWRPTTHVAFYPNSAVLANIHRWPAVFFAKGLWDRAESLEGTIAAYDRVRGLKEIVVVRGPHSMETWPQPELDRVRERMVAFAVAAVQGRTSLPRAALEQHQGTCRHDARHMGGVVGAALRPGAAPPGLAALGGAATSRARRARPPA